MGNGVSRKNAFEIYWALKLHKSTDNKMKRKSSIKLPLTALKNVFVQGFGSAGCPENK